MADSFREFADDADRTAKALRRLPAAIRRAIAARVRPEIADPLVDKIRSGGSSVYARRVATTARARSQADPTIVLGGARRVVSGGGTGRALVFGTMFGGGSRVTIVPRREGRAGYRRRSTRQFAGRAEPFALRILYSSGPAMLDRWATIVDETIDSEVPPNG